MLEWILSSVAGRYFSWNELNCLKTVRARYVEPNDDRL
jgi:hypothetical protein